MRQTRRPLFCLSIAGYGVYKGRSTLGFEVLKQLAQDWKVEAHYSQDVWRWGRGKQCLLCKSYYEKFITMKESRNVYVFTWLAVCGVILTVENLGKKKFICSLALHV